MSCMIIRQIDLIELLNPDGSVLGPESVISLEDTHEPSSDISDTTKPLPKMAGSL